MAASFRRLGAPARRQPAGWRRPRFWPQLELLESRNLLTTFTSVSYPGAPSTFLSGVNDHGQISGTYNVFTPTIVIPHAFLYQNGQFTSLDVPGAAYTVVSGINNRGQVLGGYADDPLGLSFHNFVYQNGVYTPFPDAPADAAFPPFLAAINDHGDIVGYYFTTDFQLRSFLFSNGTFTTIGPPNSLETFATGINDRGDIVGQYLDSQSFAFLGFTFSNGVYTTIEHTNFPSSFPTTLVYGINNQGTFVGTFFDYPGPEFHGFTQSLTPPRYATFDVPFLANTETIPQAINDSGEIVGYYTDSLGEPQGFIATPDGADSPSQSNAAATNPSSSPGAQGGLSALTPQAVDQFMMSGPLGMLTAGAGRQNVDAAGFALPSGGAAVGLGSSPGVPGTGTGPATTASSVGGAANAGLVLVNPTTPAGSADALFAGASNPGGGGSLVGGTLLFNDEQPEFAFAEPLGSAGDLSHF